MENTTGKVTAVRLAGGTVHLGRLARIRGRRVVLTVCGRGSDSEGSAEVVVGSVNCAACLERIGRGAEIEVEVGA